MVNKQPNGVMNRLVSIKVILTSLISAALLFAGGSALIARDNRQKLEIHDKVICKAEDDRKELKEADEEQRIDINKNKIEITKISGKLDTTNALLAEISKKLDKK
jgi:hypothetical protein